MVLPRSDSIGSASGRKYLAPTLSDPASVRSEKDKIAASKKRNSRPPGKTKWSLGFRTMYRINYLWLRIISDYFFVAMVKNNLHHLTENTEQSRQAREALNNKATVPKVSSVMLEVREWWKEQLAYSSESSEDELWIFRNHGRKRLRADCELRIPTFSNCKRRILSLRILQFSEDEDPRRNVVCA